ncbi:DUF2726 domain-containing protein [Staphylococcus pseudintermedius]|nr:DUF2726 domain-containing protein [Staphylococcus pseudintermedius]
MKKLTHEEFVESVKNNNKDIKVIGRYVDRRTKIKVKHKCGYVWETNPYTISRGHGCPKCNNNLRKTTESFKEEVFSLVGGEYTVLGEYKNNKTKIKFRHNKCGSIFEMSPKAFLNGQRCPNERYKNTTLKNTRKINEVKEEMKLFRNDEYELYSDYKGSSRPATIKHKKCGRLFKATPIQIIRNKTGCPYCYTSKGEDVVEMYLKENGYNFSKQYRMKDCRNKRPLPFDFAVFKQGKLWLLIEYDGIQHFKPKFGQENLLRTQHNDRIKNKYCETNNINLLRIPYKRFYKHEDFVAYVYNEIETNISLY